MKTTWAYKIWGIVYPIGMYYVISSLVYFVLELLLGTAYESYMLRQLISAAATIPFIWTFYRQDKSVEETIYGKRRLVPRHMADDMVQENVSFLHAAADGVLSLIAGAALGIGINNLIAMTPLIDLSAGFKEANSAFFAGKVFYELLGSCLIIPIAEELLYRGIVYKRLRLYAGVEAAVVLSAVIFGAMHFNLVQFVYAGILGILLAFLLKWTGFLYTAVLAHCAANVAAVVRQETGWLSFSYEPTAVGMGVTVLVLAVAALAILCLYQLEKGKPATKQAPSES